MHTYFQGVSGLYKFVLTKSSNTKNPALEKFKKIDREFCLSDESVNVYGYRLLTSGLKLDQYKKNPIGFFMHNREGGVLVKWDDLRIADDKVYGKPIINLAHPEGESIASQIENGFINAVSCGKIVCIDASDSPDLMLEGQTGPTVTSWYPREISFVDIPGNHNALACLYDLEDKELNLADFVKSKNPNMKKVLMTAAMLTALNLRDDSSEADAETAFQDLVDKAGKVPGLEKDLADKTTELTAKEKELNDLKAETVKTQVADLIAQGQADKKLTVEVAKKLEATFATNPEGLKDLISAMPAQTSVVKETTEGDLKDLAAFEGKKWDDLYADGKLEVVRTKFPDLYEKLKNEKFPNTKD